MRPTWTSSVVTMASSLALAGANILLLGAVGRAEGVDAAGRFIVAVTVSQLVAVLASLQLDTTIVYHLGRASRHDVLVAGRRILAGSCIVGVLFALAAGTVLGLPTPLAIVAALGVVATLLSRFAEGFLRSGRRWGRAAAGRILQAGGVVATATVVVARPTNAPVTAMLGWVASWAIFGVVAWRQVPHSQRRAPPRDLTREMLKFGWRGHIGLVAQQGNYRVDLFLVAAMAGSASAGFYGAAARGIDLLWYIPTAVSFDLLPRLVGGDATGRTADRIAGWTGLVAACAGAVAWLGSPWAIRLLFGSSFDDAVSLFRILIPGALVLVVGKIYSQELISLGRIDVNTRLAVSAVTVSVAGNLVVIPRYGATGAAGLASVLYAIQGMLTVWLARRVRVGAASPAETREPCVERRR